MNAKQQAIPRGSAETPRKRNSETGKCRSPVLVLALAGLSLFTSCSTASKLVEKRPVLELSTTALATLKIGESELRRTLRRQRHDPETALATYASVARTAVEILKRDPDNEQALKEYNFSVGRMIDTFDDAGIAPWAKPVEVASEHGAFTLTHRKDSRKTWNPALYKLTPSDQYHVGGSFFEKRTIREGLGAPVVAVAREVDPEAAARLAPSRVYYGVTAIARFDGNTCEIAIEDPLASETTRFEGHTVPLAADFTVPLAAMLEDDANNPKKQNLARYFNPGKYDETARIVGLEPYDPDKTVVLVVHGLASSQATWTPLINTLRDDAEIRRNYQFWFFSYPSGYPYPYSAMLLRQELDRANEIYPNRKPMVVIGHSMGGCISRLMMTDTGDDLWQGIFKRPPEETPLSQETRKLLAEALIFEHRPEVGRVIFMSAPLKGSELASNWIGRLGSSLERTPKRFLQVGREALAVEGFQSDELHLKRFPNSVDTLAPNNRFVKAINTIPVTPRIPHHVVAGDRGKGDAPDSTDGIVPYWSSHMDTALSEKIVPSGHGSNAHPEGIAEVGRILKLHPRGR